MRHCVCVLAASASLMNTNYLHLSLHISPSSQQSSPSVYPEMSDTRVRRITENEDIIEHWSVNKFSSELHINLSYGEADVFSWITLADFESSRKSLLSEKIHSHPGKSKTNKSKIKAAGLVRVHPRDESKKQFG